MTLHNPFDLPDTMEEEDRQVSDDENLAFEEGSLDPQAGGGLERMGASRPRLRSLWLLTGLVLVVVFGRLYYLTVTAHEEFLAVAEGNRLRTEYLPAPRGAIYDRHGALLASNRPGFELVLVPLDLSEDEAERAGVIQRVADILAVAREQIETVIASQNSQTFQSILIQQNLTREQALIFYEQQRELPGFRVVNTPIRDYETPLAFSHVLGFVGKLGQEEYEEKQPLGYLFNDSIGKAGLEQIYESVLRGSFGGRQVEVDAQGRVKKVYGEKPPLPGNNLILNIDAGLQRVLFDSLRERLLALGKKRAAVIAMDPRDGRILALLSLPGYDNNQFAEGMSQEAYQRLLTDRNQPLFNRSIGGTYPPGSTVKPMVAAAALQEGIITVNSVINDEGYIVIKNIYGGPDSFFYGFNRRALGPVAVKEAIARSSDIYFYAVGGGYDPYQIEGLGIERLASYYKEFMIDQTLGIDLPGEKAGLVPTPEWKAEAFADDPIASRWYLGNTYHVAIGQGDLLASPLHVLSWTAAIANGGQLFQPFIVDRVKDNRGTVILQNHPTVIGQLSLDSQYLAVVREGMRQTVTQGTAQMLNSLSYPVAGKTGTAQFDAKDLNRTHAWFVGYAPADNPEIALVVLIEDGGTGAASSVPVAREALDWWEKNRFQPNNN